MIEKNLSTRKDNLTHYHNTLPFLGRDQDIAEIARLLGSPDCRLLTLHGLGGVGKTRLAYEIGRRLQANFQNGVCSVDFGPLKTPDQIPAAIAEALPGFSLSSRKDLLNHLIDYFARMELLLILDNIEHLVGGAELLPRLLESAPGLKILVTSRETLKLREEWRYPVRGLAYPQEGQVKRAARDSLKQYGAVALFAALARRVLPSFSLDDQLLPVVDICQMVEGLPLALELAASWVRTLSCEAIAAYLRDDISLLHTRLRNVPTDHRSIYAVFDRSWQLLSSSQQQIYQRLIVFKGGFPLEAARVVTGAELADIDDLVDRSLIGLDGQGRYHMHALLAQFAAGQAVPQPSGWKVALHAGHSAYYCALPQRFDPQLNGGDQLAAVQTLRVELDNIRAAWDWAVQQSKYELLQQAADGLYLFYQFTGRYQEGLGRFERAVAALRQAAEHERYDAVLAEFLVHLGWLAIRVGQLAQAEKLLNESRSRYQRLAQPPPETGMATDPLVPLAVLAVVRGDFAQAQIKGKQVLTAAQSRDDLGNTMFAHYVLSSADRALGHWEEARVHAEESYTLAEANANHWFMAYCLADLGYILRALGDFEAARSYYQDSYAIKQDFNDPEGIALALTGLGEVACGQGAFSEALRQFQSSRERYEEIGDLGGLAQAEHGVGRAWRGLNQFEAAWEHFLRALNLASGTEMMPLTIDILSSMGELLLSGRQHKLAEQVIHIVLAHPTGLQETKNRMRSFLSVDEGVPVGEQEGAAGDTELAHLVDQLQARASWQDAAPDLDGSTVSRPSRLANGLTPRETEVLHLLAGGLSNREIAARLTVTAGTVKAHTHHVYQKLDARNRVEALRKAQELHLLGEDGIH